MQFAKDSFFLALQTRLAALNPTRKVTLNGSTVSAIVVAGESAANLRRTAAEYFLHPLGSGRVWLVGLAGSGYSRKHGRAHLVLHRADPSPAWWIVGRLLAQLDEELLAICQPSNTEKCDYTQSPSADMGTRVVWN